VANLITYWTPYTSKESLQLLFFRFEFPERWQCFTLSVAAKYAVWSRHRICNIISCAETCTVLPVHPASGPGFDLMHSLIQWGTRVFLTQPRFGCKVVCSFQLNQIQKVEPLFVDCPNRIQIILSVLWPVDQKGNLLVPWCLQVLAAIRWRQEIQWVRIVLVHRPETTGWCESKNTPVGCLGWSINSGHRPIGAELERMVIIEGSVMEVTSIVIQSLLNPLSPMVKGEFLSDLWISLRNSRMSMRMSCGTGNYCPVSAAFMCPEKSEVKRCRARTARRMGTRTIEFSAKQMFRALWAVDATVVKVQTQPARMRFATIWKDCEQQWFQNMTKEVLYIVIVLFSYQIDDVESIDSLNNDQHEFLGPDLLLDLLRDIVSRYAPFHRMMKFQSELTLVPSQKSLQFIFLVSLENG
jgi:hypothetical protein